MATPVIRKEDNFTPAPNGIYIVADMDVITMPVADESFVYLIIKNIGETAILVAGVIDGVSGLPLAPGTSLFIISDGESYYKI